MSKHYICTTVLAKINDRLESGQYFCECKLPENHVAKHDSLRAHNAICCRRIFRGVIACPLWPPNRWTLTHVHFWETGEERSEERQQQSLKQTGGSEERKQRGERDKTTAHTSATTSFMALLHLALHDLLIKYRLWGFPSSKIVPAKFYTTLNYFDSERFFFSFFIFTFFLPTLALLPQPSLHIVHPEICPKVCTNIFWRPLCACRACLWLHKAPVVQKPASGSTKFSLSDLFVHQNTRKGNYLNALTQRVKLLLSHIIFSYRVLALPEKKELVTWCKNSKSKQLVEESRRLLWLGICEK